MAQSENQIESCNFMGLEDTGFKLKGGIKVKYRRGITPGNDITRYVCGSLSKKGL